MHKEFTNENQEYVDALISQMRKGMLVYAVLNLCSAGRVYSANIIDSLRQAELIVVEGTLYPLLSRLIKDGLLTYEWQESEQGPPRKYFNISEKGIDILQSLTQAYDSLHNSIKHIEKGTKNAKSSIR